MKTVYLDYAASNPVDPQVSDEMAKFLQLTGNPSSIHSFGRVVRQLVDKARKQVADLLSAETNQIFFTSGATEANNIALIGYFHRLRQLYGNDRDLKLVVGSIEHASIRETLDILTANYNVKIQRLPVDADGVVRIQDVKDAIDEQTVMVCVMWVNNVIGSLQPIKDIGEVIKDCKSNRGENDLPLVFFSDAVQAVRMEEVDPEQYGVDILSLSAHKIYGPKGVGALYVKRGIELAPIFFGGGQEGGLRVGTENVLGIIGFGQAAELMMNNRKADKEHVQELSRIIRTDLNRNNDLIIYGDPNKSSPGIIYIVSKKETGDMLTLKLDTVGIAVSSGSACDTGTRKSSVVLGQICNDKVAKNGGIRISFGRFTTQDDILKLVKELQ